MLPVPLTDGWSLWPWVRLRGAGFSVAPLVALGDAGLAPLADALGATRAQIGAERARAVEALAGALAHAPHDGRKGLVTALRRLRAGTPLDEATAAEPAVARQLGELPRLERRALAEQRALTDALDAAQRRAQEVLREMARDPRFREALAWQNRGVLHHAVEGLLRAPVGAHDKDTRKREQAIASYLQRYCAKNDTIGFFGPVGWGTIGRAAPFLHLAPGPSLLARREVFFEHWCIDELARALAADPALAPHLAPRRSPTVRLEATTLHYPIERRAELPALAARVIAASDGQTSAAHIVAALREDATVGPVDEDEIYGLLADLEAQGLITFTLEVPTGIARPERWLRGLLERLPASPGRARALAALDELEAARRDVERAAGDAASVDRAIGALEERFTAIAGRAAQRRAGQSYAGRTLVYEDCVRDAEFEIGPALVARLARPLGLLLESARWYTHEFATRYGAALHAVYRTLRDEKGSATLDYLRFWERAAPLFDAASRPGEPSIADAIVAELARRWAELLAIDPRDRRLERTAAALEPGVRRRFAAPGAGWPMARFHSPDLLVAAKDEAALRRGELVVVVGELHPAVNTLLTQMALCLHPTPADLVAAFVRDLPTPTVSPVESRAFSTRADNTSRDERALHVESGDTRSWRARENVLAAAELVVEEREGCLRVRTRDGARSFTAIEFFATHISLLGMQRFHILGPAPHQPRVTVDGVVFCRERWQFSPGALGFARAATSAERFVGARAFVREHGLPRHAFFKIPEEPKPCYVDFESPTFVDLFAKLVRGGSSLSVSEMMPTLDEVWLRDAEGRRYTSEIRVAVVDERPWCDPSAAGAR